MPVAGGEGGSGRAQHGWRCRLEVGGSGRSGGSGGEVGRSVLALVRVRGQWGLQVEEPRRELELTEPSRSEMES